MTQSMEQAGLSVEYLAEGSCLRVVDIGGEDACRIRNRGGETLARLLFNDRNIKSLDIRESRILDNGIGHLCLALRQTDQLEELCLSPCGHSGLDFILGIVRRCPKLRSLHIQVCDMPTMQTGRQNLDKQDYDVSAFVPVKKEGEEEEEAEGEEEQEEPPAEEDEEEDEEVRAKKKADKLRKLFAANDYDSDEEGRAAAQKAKTGVQADPTGASPALRALLAQFIEAVKKSDNLVSVSCSGDCVPDGTRLDLQRVVDAHCAAVEKERRKAEEKGARTAYDALRDQMAELRGDSTKDVDDYLASSSGNLTRLGVRSFVNRRLFAALGEALFECQRFKSKQNQAVSTAEGEMAFIAMYLRKHQAALEEKAQAMGGQTGA